MTWVVPRNVIIDDPQSGLHIRKELPAGTSRMITFTPRIPDFFAIYCDKKVPFMKSHCKKGQEGAFEVRCGTLHDEVKMQKMGSDCFEQDKRSTAWIK